MFLVVHLPYHYRDNHVRARVFLCMLAYYFGVAYAPTPSPDVICGKLPLHDANVPTGNGSVYRR